MGGAGAVKGYLGWVMDAIRPWGAIINVELNAMVKMFRACSPGPRERRVEEIPRSVSSLPPLSSLPPSFHFSFHPTLSLLSIPPLILPSHPFPPLHLSPYPFIPPFPSPPFQLPSLTFLFLYPCYSSFIFPLMPFFFHPYLLPSSLSPSPSLTSISSLSVSPFITHACLHP